MNRIQCIRRLAAFVAGMAAVLLASVLAGPAAFATQVPPGGTEGTPPVLVTTRTVVEGGMPGWEIFLIAAGAAVIAAVLAVLLGRAHLARRKSAEATA
jgi:Flp pilus assembly protein CpaB